MASFTMIREDLITNQNIIIEYVPQLTNLNPCKKCKIARTAAKSYFIT